MAKYRVDTDKGSYMVETDDGPERPGYPKPPNALSNSPLKGMQRGEYERTTRDLQSSFDTEKNVAIGIGSTVASSLIPGAGLAANMGRGAVAGGLMEAGGEVAHGEKLSPGSIAGSAAIGAAVPLAGKAIGGAAKLLSRSPKTPVTAGGLPAVPKGLKVVSHLVPGGRKALSMYEEIVKQYGSKEAIPQSESLKLALQHFEETKGRAAKTATETAEAIRDWRRATSAATPKVSAGPKPAKIPERSQLAYELYEENRGVAPKTAAQKAEAIRDLNRATRARVKRTSQGASPAANSTPTASQPPTAQSTPQSAPPSTAETPLPTGKKTAQQLKEELAAEMHRSGTIPETSEGNTIPFSDEAQYDTDEFIRDDRIALKAYKAGTTGSKVTPASKTVSSALSSGGNDATGQAKGETGEHLPQILSRVYDQVKKTHPKMTRAHFARIILDKADKGEIKLTRANDVVGTKDAGIVDENGVHWVAATFQ